MPAGQLVAFVPAHAVLTPPETSIALAWKSVLAHAVQVMSDVAVPAAE